MSAYDVVTYKVDNTDITLTKDVVKQYLCPNQDITDQDFYLFASLCKARGINPFLKEAYLVKYGGNTNIFAGKDFFVKRAAANPAFDGIEDGIIAATESGEIKNLDGTFCPDNMKIVGGWAKVYLKGVSRPKYVTVSMTEYAKKDNNGNLLSTWKSMPGVMINKCAKVAALREAFPLEFNGVYIEEEFNGNYDKTTGELLEKTEDKAVDVTPATEQQLAKIKELVGKNAVLANKLRDYYHFEHLSDLNITEASEIIKGLTKGKK